MPHRKNNRSAAVNPNKTYYPFLDGFRAIAIIMILAHHMRRAFTLDYLFVSNPPVLKWIYFNAYNALGLNLTGFYIGIKFVINQLKGVLGVETFFVISGFLITGILVRKEIDQKSVVRFYERRFFRIYPCYFLMVVISLIVYGFQYHEDFFSLLITAVYHLLFLQVYFPLNTLLSHTWTLVVLEQFYFFCPLVILAVDRMVPDKARRRTTLIGISILLIMASVLIRLYSFKTGKPFLTWPLNSTTPYWTITANLGPICFGSLLALLEPYWARCKNNKIWGAIFWIGGMWIFYRLFFDLDWSYYWGEWYLYTCGYLSVGLLFFAAYHGVSIFARLKCFQWLGRQSYGIYVWHFLVMEFWKLWIGTIPIELILAACFISSIWVGALSTSTIEKYFLSLRDKIVPTI